MHPLQHVPNLGKIWALLLTFVLPCASCHEMIQQLTRRNEQRVSYLSSNSLKWTRLHASIFRTALSPFHFQSTANWIYKGYIPKPAHISDQKLFISINKKMPRSTTVTHELQCPHFLVNHAPLCIHAPMYSEDH
jgi:hypothetical protein